MSLTPGQEPGGRYEIVVHRERPRARAARAGLRTLRRRGQSGLHRFRAYLRTPEGHRMAVRSAQAAVGIAAVIGGVAVVRRWLVLAAQRAGALAGSFRAAFGAFAAVGRGVRRALPLRWVGSLLRWLTLGGAAGGSVRCRDCHARVRSDAAVCYRCGWRPGVPLGEVAAARRGVIWGPVVWVGRLAGLRLHRRCPDCRRQVHADARVCGACGFHLRR